MKKVRKPLSIFLSFLMMISMVFGMSFSAYADTCEYVFDEKTHTIYINATGEASDMDTALGDEKYQEVVNEAQNVVVGEGVTKIGTALFMDFDIASVSLSSTVEEIGKDAFRNTVLNEINLENVKTIGDYAFYNTYIHTADLSSVQTIGKYAFSKTPIEKLVANNCETIGAYAFASCLSLEYVETTAKTVSRYAFTKDAKISTVKLSNVVTIEQRGFFSCNGIKSIYLPKSLETIVDKAFWGCEALQSVKIEDGADLLIGKNAFADCVNLTLVYIPASVTEIEEDIFDGNSADLCVITPEGSYAEEYAINNGINYTSNTGSVTVTFDAGDGKCEKTSATYTVGDSYGNLPNCTSDNYVFKGWVNDNARKIDSDCLVYPEDHILYATYGGVVRTVNFDPAGGTLKGDKNFQVDYGQKIGDYGYFPTAKKDGYTFNGWFTESGEEVTEDTVYNFDGNITLTAHYVPITYTITLYSVVGSRVWLDKSYSVKYDEDFILPNAADIAPDIAKDKRFLGWSTSKNEKDIKYKDGQALKNMHDSQGANVDIYAIWLGYTEVTIGETKTVNISSFGTDPASYYSGFYVDEDYDYLIKVGTAGLTITLKDYDGNTIATSDNLTYGNYAKITAKLTKGNYRLNVRTQSIPCTFTITVVKTQSAKIVFDANGGTVDTTSMSVSTGDEYGSMPIPKRDGYEFDGWVDENSNAVTNTDIVPQGVKIINLKATWEPVKYTFIYFNSNGTKLDTQTITYDKASKLISSKKLGLYDAKPGYDFVGWSTAVNSSDVVYKEEQEIYNLFKVRKTVSLYPVYIKNNSKAVIYYYLNGEVKATQVVNNNSSSSLNTFASMNLSVKGYTFDGWATEVQGEVKYADGAQINVVAATEQVNLYAVLSPIKYNVEYYDTNGELLGTRRNIKYDSEFKTHTYKDLGGELDEDMMSAGWSTSLGSDTVEYKEAATYKNLASEQGAVIKLYPVIKSASKFEVKYSLGENQIFTDTGYYNDRNYVVKSPLEFTDLYSKEFLDKYFLGWSLDADPPAMVDFAIGSKIDSNDFKDAGDVTFYAVWDEFTPNDDTVIITVEKSDLGKTSVNGVDTTSGKEVEVERGSKVTLKAVANDGAEFVGWKINGKLVSIDEEFVVSADKYVTYTPVFEKSNNEEFTVVFIDMYGNVLSSQSVNKGADIVIPYIPIYPGYAFKSWSVSEEKIKSLTESTTIVANYRKDNSKTYSVKADGATITVGDKTYQNEASGIAYDTRVTVTKAGTTSWRVGNSVVSYGESYTFFIGSNMELNAVEDKNESVKTQIAIVSTDRPSASAPDVLFVGSRTIAPGETVVKQGFIYGKNVTEQDLVFENVGKTASGENPGTVKAIYNKNGSVQIGLNYGLKAMNGTVGARAFVVTKDASGNEKVTYSNISMYTY